jgi:hypothetical protein
MTDSRSIRLNDKNISQIQQLPIKHCVGYQSWNQDNLCVDSYHEDTLYYTSRWDALVLSRCTQSAGDGQKPFIVYAVPPESSYGVPSMTNMGWPMSRLKAFGQSPDDKEIQRIRKLCRSLNVTESVVPGSSLSYDDVYEWVASL